MTKLRSELEQLGEDRIAACARLVARHGNLRTSLNGKDATDFVQEALGRVMAGERSLDPARSLPDNVVRIGLSLLWAERQRQRERSIASVEVPAALGPSLRSDTIGDLHEALGDAAATLAAFESKGGVYRDAAHFVACLVQQIEARGSIKPGHIAGLLGMRRERAYAAWRKVKAVLREEMEGPRS